jgi:hypothetical protein
MQIGSLKFEPDQEFDSYNNRVFRHVCVAEKCVYYEQDDSKYADEAWRVKIVRLKHRDMYIPEEDENGLVVDRIEFINATETHGVVELWYAIIKVIK